VQPARTGYLYISEVRREVWLRKCLEKTKAERKQHLRIGGLLAAVSPRVGLGKGYPGWKAEHRCQVGLFLLLSAMCLECGIFVATNE